MPINSSKLKVKSLKFQRGFSLLFLAAIVAVVGGIVLLFMSISGLGRSNQSVPENQVVQDQQVSDLQKLSTSDEISDIEGDLNSTSLDNLNSEDKIVEKAAQGL